MVQRKGTRIPIVILPLLFVLLSASCSRLLGYGVLLWSAEDPPVPSGTVLPVYIRSNIDNVWVAGIPREYRAPGSDIDKFEVPLSKLELVGSRKKAAERAGAFASYALSYAETLQDKLPIRESPDNGARIVYRLKLGEIIKILESAEGQIAVGASGDPLEGEWFRVLTESGSAGYCFSYRLKLFEHSGGVLAAVRNEGEEDEDPVLDALLARVWSPESYGAMVNAQRLELEELSQHWCFDPGQDTGIARIKTREVDVSFSYSKIRSTGTRSWRFEGTPLQMNLRSETTLAVQFTESNGLLRTLLFVALQSEVDDIILQETVRRETLFKTIYEQGPEYTSNNYGTISFREDGQFTWTGNMLLVPQVIPASALASGALDMRLFVSPGLEGRYGGAFTLRFDGIGGQKLNADFMYSLDSQGLRLEHVPQTSLDGVTVVRRSSSPLVIYFFKSDRPAETPGFPRQFPPSFPDPAYTSPDSGYTLPGAGEAFPGEVFPEEAAPPPASESGSALNPPGASGGTLPPASGDASPGGGGFPGGNSAESGQSGGGTDNAEAAEPPPPGGGI